MPRQVDIKTKDNITLSAHVFDCSSAFEQPATIIITPAMGVPQTFYHKYAAYLSEHGFNVITFDYRGMNPQDRNGLNPRKINMRDWGKYDLNSVIEWAKSKLSSHRLFLVGQSAGGQLIGLAANNHHLDGILLVASQSGYWGNWSGKDKVFVFLFWYFFIPFLSRLLPYFPGRLFGIGENIPSGVARQWARWGRHPEYINSDHDARYFASVTAPVRFYSFDDDEKLAPKKSVEALYGFFENAEREWWHITPEQIGSKNIGHFGFFREQFKQPFWEESAQWFKSL